MRLSSMADYAVVTMAAAARHCGGARISAAQIAEETGLPAPTVQKLVSRLTAAREHPAPLTRKQASELMIAVAPYLEDFIGELFGIEADLHDLQARHNELAPLYGGERRRLRVVGGIHG